jgi:alkylation response protein AidB-like acyl-CoA dehydrogenase
MTFSLRPTYDDNPRLQDLVTRLRDYLEGELADYERELGIGPESVLDRGMLEPVWQRSRELGFYGIHLPEELGGQALTYTELAALKEEIGASDRELSTSVLGDMGGPLRGSDVRRMQTTATPVHSGFRITGHKVFSTAGTFADFSILVARMAGEDEAYSAFFVDLDSPGCRVVPGAVPMSGQNIESDVILEDCFVPAANLLGEVGQGLRISLGRVTANRLLHGPTALGAARRAIELAVDFAANRTIFDGLLLEKQAIQHRLADMVTDYYAARSMTYDALAALDAGKSPRIESFMCKLFVAERAFEIADAAVQIHGKAGMIRGATVEVLWRKLRMFRVLTGSSEIQRNGIVRELVTSAVSR